MFAGYKQKSFRGVLQNCFLSSLIGRGAKILFLRCDGTLLRCTFLNTFRSLSWKFSAGLSRLLSRCPKYIFWEKNSDFARNTSGRWTKVFQQGFKTAFCRKFTLTIWENCFSAFALITEVICQQKCFCQSLQNFNSIGRKNIWVIFFQLEQRFFGVREKKFGTHARTSFHVSRGIFWQNSWRALKEQCSAVFSETAFFIKWRTFLENVVGVQPESFSILRKSYSTLSLKL